MEDFQQLTRRLNKSRQLISRSNETSNLSSGEGNQCSVDRHFPLKLDEGNINKSLNIIPKYEYPILDLSNVNDIKIPPFSKSVDLSSNLKNIEPIRSVGTVRRIYRNLAIENDSNIRKKHLIQSKKCMESVNIYKKENKEVLNKKEMLDQNLKVVEDIKLNIPDLTEIFDNLSYTRVIILVIFLTETLSCICFIICIVLH
jgi:hypothetical protein